MLYRAFLNTTKIKEDQSLLSRDGHGRGQTIMMKKSRMIIDILMVVILPLLMAYSLIGETAHELPGICMFALFLIDYAAVMILVAEIAYRIQNGLQKRGVDRKLK